MGIIRNAANQLSRGRVGQKTYYVSGGRQIERSRLNNSNYGATARRSSAQQIRRVKWANLVNMYKQMSGWMPKAFEAKKKGQTDYNKFMQVNVNNQSVALTKNEAINGAIVVAPVQLTQGSLSAISLTKVGTSFVSNIAVGAGFTIDDNTTVGDFTAALVANNPFIVEGMQLSFVQMLQSVDANNIPHAQCVFYEVTLDSASTDFLTDFLPEDALQVSNGFLATASDMDLGGFAYIISQKTATGLKVSSQSLVVVNDVLLNKYTGSQQLNAAIDSYGLDSEVILNPESISGAGGVVAPQYISSMTLNGQRITAGSYIGNISGYPRFALSVVMANRIQSQAVRIVLTGPAGNTMTITDTTISGKTITGVGDIDTFEGPVVRIAVVGDADEYGWDFLAQEAPAAVVALTIQTQAAPFDKYGAVPSIYIDNVPAVVTQSGALFVATANVGQGQSHSVRVATNQVALTFLGWSDSNIDNPRTLVVSEATALTFSVLDADA